MLLKLSRKQNVFNSMNNNTFGTKWTSQGYIEVAVQELKHEQSIE